MIQRVWWLGSCALDGYEKVANVGPDPYICCGIYVAPLFGRSQIHFNYKDSIFLAGATTALIIKWGETLPPPFDAIVISVASGLGAVTIDEVTKHNCIGIEAPWVGLPSVTLYRSKGECG
jgi:hypothetical protein